MLRVSTDILKSIKNRFYKTVQDFPSLEITDTLDPQIRLLQCLSRLPYYPWTHLSCSTPGNNSLDEDSATGKIFNFNWSFPCTPAKYEAREGLQEKKPTNRKRSGEKYPSGSHAIDDNITPERRPRAYDLDRTKTPRRLRHP